MDRPRGPVIRRWFTAIIICLKTFYGWKNTEQQRGGTSPTVREGEKINYEHTNETTNGAADFSPYKRPQGPQHFHHAGKQLDEASRVRPHNPRQRRAAG